MSERQEIQDAYNEWYEEFGDGEFIEYSHEAYEKLLATTNPRLVWTNHSTCENERYTNGIQEFQSGCGCWQVFGWHVSTKPWECADGDYIMVGTEWSGPCFICNEDGSDESINPDCEQCDGEGYTQDYFD